MCILCRVCGQDTIYAKENENNNNSKKKKKAKEPPKRKKSETRPGWVVTRIELHLFCLGRSPGLDVSFIPMRDLQLAHVCPMGERQSSLPLRIQSIDERVAYQASLSWGPRSLLTLSDSLFASRRGQAPFQPIVLHFFSPASRSSLLVCPSLLPTLRRGKCHKPSEGLHQNKTMRCNPSSAYRTTPKA